jgi:hypothetical protein
LKHTSDKWYNQTLNFEEASEPTDIMWEHGHVSQKTQNWRFFKTLIISVIILTLTFTLLSFLWTYESSHDEQKYGKLNCETAQEFFDTDLEYQEAAIDDYRAYYIHRQKAPMSGILQCFCTDLKEKIGNGVGKLVFMSKIINPFTGESFS